VKSLAEESVDYGDRKLAELFRLAMHPRSDPFRKRRVLVKLERMQRRNFPRFWLRPLMIAALFLSGSAAAELGHRYVSLAPALFRSAPESASAAARVTAFAPVRVPNCVSASEPKGVTAAPTTVPDPSAAPSTTPRTTPRKNTPSPTTEASGDPDLVAEAIRALRTEGNPSHAQTLLDAYLTTHPQGALCGEALALSIEAASARHNPHAVDYAHRYLAAFPHGKYRELAARAIELQALGSTGNF
jgi:hypothetical protein